MKTNIFLKALLCVLLFPVLFSSCKEDDENFVIWDLRNIVVAVNVVDGAGNNLMDPATENSIAGNYIKVTFRGKTYNLDEKTEAKSRENLPKFRGLYSYDKYRKEFQYGLFFGEFDGGANYDKEEIVIDWGDGSKKDVIVLDHKFWWENDTPHMETTYYLNDKKVDGDYVTIVK